MDRPAAVIADVGRPANVDLARWQKHIHAGDVDQQAALDLAGHVACHNVVFLDAAHHPEPVFDAAGLPLREHNQATLLLLGAVFKLLQKHLDDIADLRCGLPLFPLVAWDRPFALVADVNEHKLVIDSENLPLKHGVDGKNRRSAAVFFLDLSAPHEVEFGFQVVSGFKFTDEITIDHEGI